MRTIAALLLASGLFTCQRAVPSGTLPGSVTHVVVCWLAEPGNEAHRDELIRVSKTFADIPGVASVSVGPALPSERPIVVSGFDVAIVMVFESEQAMRDYLAHPDHEKAVRETLKPLAREVKVYDIVNR